MKRASIFYLNEKSDEAIQDYMESARLFLKSGDSIFAADAYYFGGQAYSNKSDFIGSINNYKKAVELYEILGDQQYALVVGSEASGLYSRNGFVEKGLEERERLLEKAIQLNNLPAQAQIVGQNVVDYYRLKKFTEMDNQLVELKKIVDGSLNEVSPDQHMFYHLAYINYKLILECERKNIAEANELMKQLTEKTKSKDLGQYLETGILAAKSDYYSLINDQKNLLPILKKLANIKTTHRFGAQIKAREHLAAIYKRQGKLKQALELNEMNTRIKDSIYNAQKTNTFLYYQSEFEAEKKQRELAKQDAQIQQLEAEQKLAANQRNTIIAAIVAFFLVAILFFYLINRQKIKEQAYQNILLNNKIANKTEEINVLLSETIRHIKSKERIAENLQKLSNEKEGITLKSIIADLRASKADNAKLMLIKQNIEQVNYEFIKKLKELHPELTKTDIEICSLIRIGLSRKEVANLRNTSLEAVKTSRFRLKKKLHLTAQQSLDDYVNAL